MKARLLEGGGGRVLQKDIPVLITARLQELLVVDRTHPQSNKFVTVVKNQATGDPKLNDSPDSDIFSSPLRVTMTQMQKGSYLKGICLSLSGNKMFMGIA